MCYSVKISRHRQNGSSFVPTKILTCELREAGGTLKATAGKRVTITLSTQFFVAFCFFQPEARFAWQAVLKTIPSHFRHCSLSQAEL